MKNLKKLKLLALMPLCFSCNDLNNSTSINENDDNEDIEKEIIYRNLDIEATSFYKAMKYSSPKKISQRIENGENLLLFLHQDSCSHCKVLEPTFMQLLKEQPIEINYFSNETIQANLNELFSYSPYLEKGFGDYVATPTLFLLNKIEARKIDLIGTYTNLDKLNEALFRNINLSNVYISSKNLSFSNDGLYLLYKENKPSLYYEYMKEKAETSNKNTYLYDVSKLNEEEIKNKFNITLSEKDYVLIKKEKETINCNFEEEEIKETINSYY